jgi:hypothetical protein
VRRVEIGENYLVMYLAIYQRQHSSRSTLRRDCHNWDLGDFVFGIDSGGIDFFAHLQGEVKQPEWSGRLSAD